jgi:hypothetical protein
MREVRIVKNNQKTRFCASLKNTAGKAVFFDFAPPWTIFLYLFSQEKHTLSVRVWRT